MKRKPPKNQRPYSSPGGKKPKLVPIHDEHEENWFVQHEGQIDCPHLYFSDEGIIHVEANQLAKWRASQPTSAKEQP